MAKSRKGIKFEQIDAQKTSTEKANAVISEIARVKVPCLSDALVSRSVGGQAVIVALDKAQSSGIYDPNTESYGSEPLKWRLRKIKNADGSAPKPGDEVRVLFKREQRDAADHKLSAEDWQNIKRRGGQGQERYHVYKLDQNCEFECNFADAMQLLTNRGVHYETGLALCNYKETEGISRVTYNWQYIEVVEGVNDVQDSGRRSKGSDQ